jgi:IclR family acetate operon transcriptional repressor
MARVRPTEWNDRGILARMFRILDACARDGELTLSQIAAGTRLPKSTAHRMVKQLVAHGALEGVDHTFRLGPRLFELGVLVPYHRHLRDIALPFIEDLYEVTHEIVHLAVLEGTEILYVEKICGHRHVAVETGVGARMPANCTGLGKTMLAFSSPDVVSAVVARGLARRTPNSITEPGAFLDELRLIAGRGVAFDREEAAPGVTCVAAPILNTRTQAIGALSVTGPAARFDPARVAHATRLSALAVSAALGASKSSRA